MKKVLIIGAGIEQVGVIKIAKEMGLEVIVTDKNPQAPGVEFADRFYEVSTTDHNGNANIGIMEEINGVMTVCSESAVPTVAFVSEELNLPGFSMETALMATNKAIMREILCQYNVKVAPYVIASRYEEAISFIETIKGPWVIKPIDNSGQRGSSLVHDRNMIRASFLNALDYSKENKVLIDKYIKGPEVHVTIQVIDSVPYFLALSDRVTLDSENFGIAVRHIGPSNLDHDTQRQIEEICNKTIKALSLKDGIVTCELIISGNEVYLMELAIRVPGGYLREVAMYLSGVDIYKTTIWNCLGIKKKFEEMKSEKSYPAVSVKFISAKNIPPEITKITDVNDFHILRNSNVKLVRFHFAKEFDVPELSSSVGRFAAIICVGGSRKEAVIQTEEIFNSIRFNNSRLIEYTNYSSFNINFQSYLNNDIE